MRIKIVLPVSRDTYLSDVFSSLSFLELPNDDVSLLVYVDGDARLLNTAKNYALQSRFNNSYSVIHRNKGVASSGDMLARRNRIANVHNEIKAYLGDATHLFLIEDDTTFPANTLKLLLKDYGSFTGISTGVQAGRHGYKHLGLWRVNDVYSPTQIQSLQRENGVREIDACGMFCMLVAEKYYTMHDFKPYGDILGPDFDFGLSLRQLGLVNKADFNIDCLHLTPKNKIDPLNDIIQIEFNKTNGSWNRMAINQ